MASRIVVFIKKVAPGRERAIALRSFPDWPALPLRGFCIGALSPRRGGVACDASPVAARGNVDRQNWTGRHGGLTSSRLHGGPVFFRSVQGLNGLPQGCAGLVVGKTLAHDATMRRAHAACHGASRAVGAP